MPTETPQPMEASNPRARAGEILRLFSESMCALAGMVLMTVLLFGGLRLVHRLEMVMVPTLGLDLIAAILMLPLIFYPPVVFLRAAASRAKGTPEPFRRSCVEAFRRLPALTVVMVFALGYWILLMALVMLPVLMLKSVVLTAPEIRPPLEQSRAILWFVYALVSYLIAFPLVVRAGLLAPLMAVNEGMNGLDAWRFSWTHTTRRMAARALPYFLPAVALNLLLNTWSEPFRSASDWVFAIPGPGIFLLMQATMILPGIAAIVIWRDMRIEPEPLEAKNGDSNHLLQAARPSL